MKPIELLIFLFASVFVVATQGSVDEFSCIGKKNGYYEISCKSFVKCKNGQKTVHYCKDDTVLDINKMKCRKPDKVPKPCGEYKDCSNKKDGRYPDLDYKCKSYYTCYERRFMGHNFCPKGLVFNEAIGNCDWPYNVPPPCGTKTF